MKNKERAISIVLILQLVLALLTGVLISAAEVLFKNDYLIKTLSVILLVLRYLIPIFLYCKLTEYTPFVSSLNSPHLRENSISVRKKGFLFIFGFALAVTVLNSVGMLTDILFSAFGQLSDEAVLQGDTVYRFIKTVCLAAIVEEILFRGAVLHAFSGRSNGTRVIISALTFALMHGNIRQFFYAFAVGLVIAFFTVLTNSLTLAVLIHFGANLITFVFSVLKQQLDAEVYTWVSLLVLSVFVLGAVLCAFLYFLKIREKEKSSVKTEEGRYPTELTVYLFMAAAVTVICSF